MSNYRIGDVIRMTRNCIGMSQEKLSEGICSVQTLHRIENGKTGVKKEVYSRLMKKMERISEKNYAVCIGKDLELIDERNIFDFPKYRKELEKEKNVGSIKFHKEDQYKVLL